MAGMFAYISGSPFLEGSSFWNAVRLHSPSKPPIGTQSERYVLYDQQPGF